MLKEEYKKPASSFKFEAPYVGYALCCGVRPMVDFDSKLENAKYYVGHIACPKCGNQVGVIANGGGFAERVGFLYQYWNRNFPNGPYDAILEPFKWGELDFTTYYMGEKTEYRSHFEIMHLTDKKWIRYSFHQKKLIEFVLPIRTRPTISFSESKVSCSNDSWLSFRLRCNGGLWGKRIQEFLNS